MKYRVLLTEPGNTTRERPHQMLTNSWEEAQAWTKKALDQSQDPGAIVEQFETVERKIGLVVKQPKETAAK